MKGTRNLAVLIILVLLLFLVPGAAADIMD
jgi:hypothetical protein